MTILIIVRYPRFFGWAGFLSMALFRFPLWLKHSIGFWKLMGCGKNGTFDKTPDWRQWAVMMVYKPNSSIKIPSFLSGWWYFFNCEIWKLELEPIEGHGLWDGKEPFGNLPKQTEYEGPICVLTRATIRITKLNQFWSHVDAIASKMANSKGFITSVGIGEVPWIKQATFSIWYSKADMKTFAYQMKDHAEVVVKTKKEKWYSEELFVRFRPLNSTGKMNGILPFEINP